MIPIPVISWILTMLIISFFFLQFGAEKGTRAHIIRGGAIPALTIIVILLNTISIGRTSGLRWDGPFLTHFLLGVVGLICLVITVISGIFLSVRPNSKVLHRASAIMTAVFFA